MSKFTLTEPPTEIEIAQLNEQLTPAGKAILRRLTFQRDQLLTRGFVLKNEKAILLEMAEARTTEVRELRSQLYAEKTDSEYSSVGRHFQSQVAPWILACFGPEIAGDTVERNHRFLEEALELAQACDCTSSEAHQLVDYTFGRPIGEKAQEIGGVMVTLAALCLAHGLDMHSAGVLELDRIWKKMPAIRAKQAAKPKHSPLAE